MARRGARVASTIMAIRGERVARWGKGGEGGGGIYQVGDFI